MLHTQMKGKEKKTSNGVFLSKVKVKLMYLVTVCCNAITQNNFI